MSTYLYLECLDHQPPLRSEDEVGQHLYDLPQIRALIAKRAAISELGDDVTFSEYFDRAAARFLRQHPKCHLRIVDEYDQEHQLDEEPPR